MIDVLFFSVAGKKQREVITTIFEEMLELDYIPAQDKKVIKHTIEVAKNGSYPAKTYYNLLYENSGMVYSSTAEIITYYGKTKEFFKKEWINKQLIGIINDSTTERNTVEALHLLIASSDTSADEPMEELYKPILYSETIKRPYSAGILLGIPDIDQLTNGLQPGTVSCVAAFVAEGKSTLTLSVVFKNALAGKKCAIFSLEMAPEIVWAMVQTRYLYEVKGMQITTQDLIFKRLSDKDAEMVEMYEPDFLRDICSNLIILDEAAISKQIMGDAVLLGRLFKKIDISLGGLDLTVWDHVGQLELLYPDMGNQCIRNITSATKTYTNTHGTRPHSMFAVQTNREGRKRAARRGGVYDLSAISDLNEVERSCTYCIFLFTSDDSKIVQETKISMLKHRLGGVLPDPATVSFMPAIMTVGSNVEIITADLADFGELLGSSFEDQSF